jgi:hypothetical protein
VLVRYGQWNCKLKIHNKDVFLGPFESEEEASKALEIAKEKRDAAKKSAASDPSKPTGVDLSNDEWRARSNLHGKSVVFGSSDSQREASESFQVAKTKRTASERL